MPQVFIVTLETPLPEAHAAYVKGGAGKAVAREIERIDFAARKIKVTALTALVSESREALAAQMVAEGFDPARMRLPAELWHPAADGLKSVRGLIDHVTAHLNDFKQPNPILRDLKATETLLVAAEAAGVKFHFTKAVA